jgi:hypothetical protein
MAHYSSGETQPNKLWYQDFPAVETLFGRMAAMPLPYQIIIAEQVNQTISRYQKEASNRSGEEPLKSLGASLVMDMMKYRHQPLWFNQDASVRQAVMQLPHLGIHTQKDLLFRIKISLETIDAFVRQCQAKQSKPDERSVNALIENVFSRSNSDIKQLTQKHP